MGVKQDGLVYLSSVDARQQFLHSRASPTTCAGTRLGECGREEEGGAVLCFTPYKPCEILPSAILCCDGQQAQHTRLPWSWERGMLFIQFGAEGTWGGGIFDCDANSLGDQEQSRVARSNADLPSPACLSSPPAVTLPTCPLNKQCFYRALASVSNLQFLKSGFQSSI